MYSELRTLLYEAESNYLQTSDIEQFKKHVASLQERVITYELLREHEIALFQPVADQLLAAFPAEDPQLLERAIKHWLAVMRYCAMAMLLNNPEFLQRRLLEWLTDIVKAHQMTKIENRLYELLQDNLKKYLSGSQLALLHPFLEQAQTTLISDKVANEA